MISPLNFSHMFAIVLIISSYISFTQASSIIDIYLDNQAFSSSRDGTTQNPYIALYGVFNELSNKQYDASQINIHIAPSPQSYDLDGANYQISGQDSNNISFATWDNDSANQLSQDLSRVILNLKDSTLKFDNFLLLSISNIVITSQNGLISIENSDIIMDQTTLDVPVIQDEALIEIKDSRTVAISHLNITATAYSSFITFISNDRKFEPSVWLGNILIKLNLSTEMDDSSLNVPALINFTCKLDSARGAFAANNIKVETSDESTSLNQMSPTILHVTGFDKTDLTSFILSNQSYITFNPDPTISFKNINKLNISSTLITANDLSTNSSLFSVKGITNLYFQDFEVSSNKITVPNTTNLYLINISSVHELHITNQTFTNNSITGSFALFNFEREGDSNTLNLKMSDIVIANNSNSSMNCQFNYFSLVHIVLDDLLIKNVNFTNNRIFGTVFSFSNMPQVNNSGLYTSPKLLNFTNIAIQDNQQLYDLNFIDFAARDTSIKGSNCIQLVEPYTLWIQDLQVINNTFAKGASDLFIAEISLFRSEQVQIFLQAPIIANNTFEYYNFVSVEDTPSTIIISSAYVTNNTLHSSQLLNTHFVNTDTLCDPFQGGNRTAMRMLYRYTFIMDSVFSDIMLDSSTLFNSNNGLSVLAKNDFKNINLTNSDFTTTKFKPLSSIPNINGYARDTSIEELTVGYNLRTWKILNETLLDATNYDAENLFFYSISKNNFTSINILDSEFITLLEYGFSQSFISMKNNNFEDLEFDGGSDDAETASVFYCFGLKTFAANANSFNQIQGDPNILELHQQQDSDIIEINSNIIYNASLNTFVSYDSARLGIFNFNGNNFTKVKSSNNLVLFAVQKSSGNWRLDQNYLNNIHVSLEEASTQASRFGLISLSDMKSSKDTQIIITNSILLNITFEKSQNDLYDEHFSAFIIQTHRSVNLDNISFSKVQIKTLGNLIRTMRLSSLSFSNSIIKDITANSPHGIVALSGTRNNIFNVTFTNVTNTAGSGAFFLVPFEARYTIDISNSIFEKIDVSVYATVLTIRPSITEGLALMNLEDTEEQYKLELNIANCHINNTNRKSIVYLSSINCDNCTITNGSLAMEPDYANDIGMINLHHTVTGIFEIQGINISSKHQNTKPFLSINGSNVQTTLEKIEYRGSDSALYLATLNSGSLIIKDSTFMGIQVNDTPIINIDSPENSMTLRPNSQAPQVFLENVLFNDIACFEQFPYDSYKVLMNNFITEDKPQQVMNSIISMTASTLLSISNTTFKESDFVGAIVFRPVNNTSNPYISNSSILIENSSFRDLSFIGGAALMVIPTLYGPNITIKNSKFTGNQGFYASSCLSIYNASLNISDSTFNGNTGYLSTVPTISLAKGAEKAYQSNNLSFLDSKETKEVLFEPVGFRLSFKTNFSVVVKTIMNHNNTTSTISLSNTTNRELQSSKILLEAVDAFGNPAETIQNTDMKIVLQYPAPDSFDLTNLQSPFVYENETVSSIDLTPVNILGSAHKKVPLIIQYSSIRMTGTITVDIYLRECIPGEYDHSETCELCPANTYSLNPKNACSPCPDDATCPGGAIIYPKNSFWSANTSSVSIYPCLQDDVQRCISPSTNATNTCTEGYTGPMCEACDFNNSYVENGYLRCGECVDAKKSFIYSTILSSLYFIYQIFSIYAIYNGNIYTHSRQNDYLVTRGIENSFYIKSLLTYTQLMSILYMRSPDVYKSLGLSSQVGNPSTLIVYGTQCSMLALGINPSDFIYYNLLIVVSSPVVQFVAIALTLIIISCIRRKSAPRKVIVVTALYFIISEQPGIVSNLGLFLTCSTIDGVGYNYISSHPNWSCDTSQYSFFAKFIAIPNLILWCALIPIVTLVVLIINRKQINSRKMRVAFGVILFDVKDKHYYWGVVLMVLKLALSAFVFELELKNQVQIFISLVLLWTYQSFVKMIKPYKSDSYNNFEIILINLLMLNIIITQYLISPSNGNFISESSLVLSVIVNGSFLFFLAWKILSLTFLNAVATYEKSVMKRRVSRHEDLSRSEEMTQRDDLSSSRMTDYNAL